LVQVKLRRRTVAPNGTRTNPGSHDGRPVHCVKVFRLQQFGVVDVVPSFLVGFEVFDDEASDDQVTVCNCDGNANVNELVQPVAKDCPDCQVTEKLN
jgi:hypothetical protein